MPPVSCERSRAPTRPKARSAPRSAAAAGPSTAGLAQLQRLADVSAPVQRLVSLETAKAGLNDGRVITSIDTGFFGKHVAREKNSNLSAADTHATRPNPRDTNTVVTDSVAFKAAVAGGTWAPSVYKGAPQWTVVSSGNVDLQDTVRRQAIAAAPQPVRLNIETLKAEPDHFTTSGGTFTGFAHPGVTEDDLPVNMPSKGRNAQQNREKRKAFLEVVQRNLTARYGNERLAWLKQNFATIGATAIHGNAAIDSLDKVEAVARRSTSVTVTVSQAKGEINHLAGTDD
ncbi:MAG: hypothetical protein KDK29_11945 [Sedimentitalea sp.]|nr:hypothetical protein [Sedimentitalea sp.]